MPPDTDQELIDCYHCSLPVPDAGRFQLSVAGETHEYCCAGCMAVSDTINSSGLLGYYQQRDLPALRPINNAGDKATDYRSFDHFSV